MDDKELVRSVINAFYKSAGITKTFSGDINEEVAITFGKMLSQSYECSESISWVPRPTGVVSISWIVRNFKRSIIERLRNSQYFVCARWVVYNWTRKMDMASLGV